ncbi:G1/S-specific cyclin pas1 [Coniochaeta hoffmannii]|uniref:G1/S-specific cyclin pas1 n=1 Tax=Coniochaeta hoffmannii TaxID=91930 RepID=A0AA38RMD1_9PEZI|nr:G1/S-specific cyclin pas1 [Coniochaeta hoffmannii]
MQAWRHGLASPPPEYNHPDLLDGSGSQSSDNDSECSSSATLASTASSLSTLASAASTSAWSLPSSQTSDFTSYSVAAGYESIHCGQSQDASQQNRPVAGKLFTESLQPGLAFQQQEQTQYQSSQPREAVPPELRKNPRRTSAATSASRGCPPTLSRQVDRKVEFVDKLVDSATYIVEAIWPTSSVPCRSDFDCVLPLRKFIEETLRRSRTSYSTLQVGLYYLILIKPHIPAHDFTMEQTGESHARRALQCGRRMFLAALILASKWLQDRNYSARAWSKISGLQISEINENERAFLGAVRWNLHVTEDLYKVWSDLVMEHTPSMPPPPGAAARCYERQCATFKELIQGLTPELDNLHDLVPAKKTRSLPGIQSAATHPSSIGPPADSSIDSATAAFSIELRIQYSCNSSSQSRTSSISSASLSHNAPAYMQARRATGERQRMVYGLQYRLGQSSLDDTLADKRRNLAVADIVDIPEQLSLEEADVRIPSPDSYDTYLSKTRGTDQSHQLSMCDAALALQELHNHRDTSEPTPKPLQTRTVPVFQGPKRKRAEDGSALQENVRDLLTEERSTMWSDEMVGVPAAHAAFASPTKRVRLSAASSMYQPHLVAQAYGQHRLIPAM